jgi:hypothetical protein
MDLRRWISDGSRMDGSTAISNGWIYGDGSRMDLGWMDLGWMDLGWMDLGWIYGDGSRMDLGWMDLRRWISDGSRMDGSTAISNGWIYGDGSRMDGSRMDGSRMDGSRMDGSRMDLRRWISDGWIYGDGSRMDLRRQYEVECFYEIFVCGVECRLGGPKIYQVFLYVQSFPKLKCSFC